MFKLSIETDNDAFAGDNLTAELAKIMQRIVIQISDEGQHIGGGVCWDSNGNNVGEWILTTDEDEEIEEEDEDAA